MTIDELRKSGLIAYEYIRGSHAYGLNTDTSDIDIGGVFICPKDNLYGLRSKYVEQVADEKNDTVFYEFGRWVELLMKANPTALESLFVPKKCVIGEIHPMIQHIINHRDVFLSKECFKTLTGYATSQIGKARGLNKKIVNPVTERKTVLDFCNVPYNQGSLPVEKWLTNNGLKQKYCALVPLPNMHDVYGLYYDFGTHIICEYGVDLRDDKKMDELAENLQNSTNKEDVLFVKSLNEYCEYETIFQIVPSGYHGIVSENSESNDVRTESIPKGKQPITVMSFNKDGYTCHCKKYKEYQEWVVKRNPVRYENNLGHNYDSKNMCHCMRLTRMGKELAMGMGLNVERTYDRDYLLSIRNHELEYDEIMAQAIKEREEMEAAAKTSTLPDYIDADAVNRLLIEARSKFYG